MIDLHTHSTASDGLLPPSDLVHQARAAGLSVFSITDHDTVAGCAAAADVAAAAGVELVPGIEISAVSDGRDVHILGYFIDVESPALRTFISGQREERLRRVREMGRRLGDLGCPIDIDPILDAARAGRSVGRPQVAAALMSRGYVATRDDAFARFLEFGAPAFVPRCGASPEQVVGVIHAAGGVASLAHPGLTRRDEIIPALAAAGLDALEVRHSDHDAATEAKYCAMASHLNLLVTAGSDFHGDTTGRRQARLGGVSLHEREFAALKRAAAR